ncbi:right-handed parallel beta-helix repeat-containing protein [Streptomyces noursei]|uniref:right-handed parallel beta-helix repeat-containing protein n=1 Tax=Streptomyces noursei TaxID=1971 RepID=UPI00081C41D2|nr:Right handed beta helix region [Streptomyces noursei ATCC 11455]MCZ0995847.1 right-handed parallel beta-helix repeat-containing protein [Streptomyces noursei]
MLTVSGGYGLHLDGASYRTVQGITVAGGQKGIVMDSANRVVIGTVTVHDLAMEGVRFRTSGKDGIIRNCAIRDTGKNGRGTGEGVYVGGTDDRSDNVQILDNTTGAGRHGFDIADYDAGGCPVTIAGDNTVSGGRGVADPGIPVGQRASPDQRRAPTPRPIRRIPIHSGPPAPEPAHSMTKARPPKGAGLASSATSTG